MLQVMKAVKQQLKLRMLIEAPTKGGKTYTALLIAKAIVDKVGGQIGVIDSEHRRSLLYADEFPFLFVPLEDEYNPRNYLAAIELLEKEGCAVIIGDSLSHAWMGTGGVLDIANNETIKAQSRNTFTDGWRKATPVQNEFVEGLLKCKAHFIGTLRSKMAYELQEDKNGKKKPVKLGLAPVQRDNFEYEFDVVGTMDLDHNISIEGRCKALDGKVINKPDGKEMAKILLKWLGDGAPTDQQPEVIAQAEAKKDPPTQPTNGNSKNGSNGKGKGKQAPPPTQAQVEAMFAKATELGLDMSVLKKVLAKRYKIATSLDLTPAHLKEIMGDEKSFGVIQRLADGTLTLDKVPAYPAELPNPLE